VGALANLGYEVCDQTVGNVLQRNGLPPAPERKRTTSWPAFIRTHLALLAGTDFFTAEVLTLRGLITYYVLFFIHLESRRVVIAGITIYPDEPWMQQVARSSNSLAALFGLAQDCAQRKVLGEATPITVAAYDETNIRVRPDRLARDIRAAGGGMVGLVGVQSNQYPRAMDLARRFRALGI
jgi:hypothetical protein